MSPNNSLTSQNAAIFFALACIALSSSATRSRKGNVLKNKTKGSREGSQKKEQGHRKRRMMLGGNGKSGW